MIGVDENILSFQIQVLAFL